MKTPLMFGGIPVRTCDYLPKTKTVAWITERKWYHRRKFPADQYRRNSMQVSCETVFMFGGAMVMSTETAVKLQLAIARNAAR